MRILCAEGKVSGVICEGRRLLIPADTRKPVDGRLKAAESLLAAIDRKKSELSAPISFLVSCHFAGGRQERSGITIPRCQPEVVYKIIIGAKGRQFFGGCAADEDGK